MSERKNAPNIEFQNIHLLDIATIYGEKGALIALEQHTKFLPFDLKRLYYLFDVPNASSRGAHAHKKLKQLLICMSGTCTIKITTKYRTEEFVLDSPKKGLLICEPAWRDLYDFSSDGLVLVCASELYDLDDYIWDFDEFLNGV